MEDDYEYYYPDYPEQPYPREMVGDAEIEAICECGGHQYHGEDSDGPRCYCGKRRDFPLIDLPEVR